MDDILVESVPGATDEVRLLVGELDRVLAAEYPPEQRHGLALDAIFQPHVRFFLARHGGTAVGCGGVAFFPGFAEVKRMYVRDAARGRGVAQALLARIESEVRGSGRDVLRLETGDRQAAALRFYERAGFRPCAAFGDYAAMAPRAVATSVFLEKRLAARPPRPYPPTMTGLTHLDPEGRARMVDVSAKPEAARLAVARAAISMLPETLELIRASGIAKGDVLAVARLAGIMGAKRTSELIPLCHPLALTSVEVTLELDGGAVEIEARCRVTGRTGVEMEALTAVSVAALTVYDMCKAVDRSMVIGPIRLVHKSGGRSGNWDAP